MPLCECSNWARESSKVFTDHHPRCQQYDPEGDAFKIVVALIEGIDAWAGDEDGVHPDCWGAYKMAEAFVGRIPKNRGE